MDYKEFYEKVKKVILNKITDSLYNEYFHLYSDEGGAFGTPRFILYSINKPRKIPVFFEYHGKMTGSTIASYLTGRYIGFYFHGFGDYTDNIDIEIK